jgi:putative transcriptional regulator
MKKYKSEAFEAIHEFISDLYKAGGISDERMSEYDEACLIKPPVSHFPARRPAGETHSGTTVYAHGK